ncbi:MAG: GTPase Era [Candidatus Uhrbacteria bacterium]|nr:GTPase Era [Candidatus Uhrbacteria bacterium]
MKSGFAVMIGRSNVGKSTLLNSLVGTKVAITTPKPQTTRKPVQGVLTTDEGQVVFVDTPGVMQKARDPLTKKLLQWVEDSLRDIEVILYVVDPTRPIGNEEKKAMQLIAGVQKPKLLVINKIDEKSSNRNIAFYRDLFNNDTFDAMVEVSAIRGTNLDLIKRWIFENLPEGELMYPESDISNMRKEEQIAELIREKLFLRLRQEVPYSTHVEVEEIDQRKNGVVYIKAVIYTTDERYKSMIIGKEGRGISEIGRATRNELEAVTQQKFYLDLNVQVDSRWLDRLV